MSIDPLTIATSMGGWLWDTFAPTAAEEALDVFKSRWKNVSWSKSEETYRRRLTELYSSTKLLGNPKPIRIDKIYTDVYVLDQLTAYRRLRIDKASGTLQESSGLPATVKRKPLLEIVRDRNRVYVLGKPGAGKSTFLRKLCLLCCTGEINRTPIFISLKEWHDSQVTLEEFIYSEFKICGFPEPKPFVDNLLERGLVLLLLDGLDEIPPDNDSRQKATTALTRLARQHPTVQIVLTCRIAAAEYSFDQFDYFEIADFTEEQQHDFADKWYESNAEARRQFAEQWRTQENSPLRDLARTPLLLALLCLAFDETLTFPRRRVDLYQEATNALLRRWDGTRGIRRDQLYKTLSHGRREQLLAQIAGKTFTESQVFFPTDAAAKIINEYLEKLPPRDESRHSDAADLLRAIEAQHGLLVERAIGIYSFSHLTIHEYFTAKYLVESSRPNELHTAVLSHFFEDSWREVFLMTMSILDDATPLFGSVKELFERRFFSSPVLLRLFDASTASQQNGTDGMGNLTQAAHLEGKVDFRNETGPVPSSLRKANDLCETLAASFHFIKCGGKARQRAAGAFPRILEIVLAELESSRSAAVGSAKLINEYLQACTIVVESMEFASVSGREEIVNSLVFPDLSAWKEGAQDRRALT